MAAIRGEWSTHRIWIDGREVLPERSLRVRNHSPTGFSWGHGGGEPAQLALALLLEITTEELALLWYQEVKWHVIAKLPQTDFTLDAQAIISFMTGAVNAELVQGPEPLSLDRWRPPGVLTSPDTREVELRYSRNQLHALFDLARAEDIEHGGRYDARSGAINIYTHPWNDEAMRIESTLMGSIYVFGAEDNRIWQIQMDEGFSLEDLLLELGRLEEKAIGRKVHGR